MIEDGRHMYDLIGSQHIHNAQQQVMLISQAIGHGVDELGFVFLDGRLRPPRRRQRPSDQRRIDAELRADAGEIPRQVFFRVS